MFGNEFMKVLVCFGVGWIEGGKGDDFKMFVRDMGDERFDEVDKGDGLVYIFMMLVWIVMKSEDRRMIFVDGGSGDERRGEIGWDIFDGSVRMRRGRVGIKVKWVVMRRIREGFDVFERMGEGLVDVIKERGRERRR